MINKKRLSFISNTNNTSKWKLKGRRSWSESKERNLAPPPQKTMLTVAKRKLRKWREPRKFRAKDRRASFNLKYSHPTSQFSQSYSNSKKPQSKHNSISSRKNSKSITEPSYTPKPPNFQSSKLSSTTKISINCESVSIAMRLSSTWTKRTITVRSWISSWEFLPRDLKIPMLRWRKLGIVLMILDNWKKELWFTTKSTKNHRSLVNGNNDS